MQQPVRPGEVVPAAFAGSDALARGLAEASPDALVVIDGDGRIAFANRRCEATFGYSPSDLVGQPLEILLSERHRDAHREHLATYARASRPRATSGALLIGRRRDGTEFPVEILLSPIETPRATLFAASVRDATDRDKASRVLRESEERFRLAFDAAPIGMALVGLDGRFLRVNCALCCIVGYSPEELAMRTFQDITHPDDLDIDNALAGQLERGEIPSYQLAKRYITKDGSAVHVMLHGSVLRDPSGTPLYFLAQVEDITARLEAEAALRRSEGQFRELVEQAPEAVFVADLTGRYTNVNSAAGRLLGYAPEELVGKTILDLIPTEEVARLTVEKELLLTGDHVEVSEWTLRKKNGSLVDVEVSAKIHPDGRWVAFVRDMSERKRAEEALRRSEASLARAQRVAHLGSWDWDVGTNHVVRSDELFALFGLAPGATEPQRWSLAPYIHPDDRERVAAVVDGAVREGRPYTLEHRIVRADGAERIVLQQGEPVSENGRTVRVVGTLLDITERRQAELEREASFKWLSAVFEHSPVALLLVHGPNGERVEANSRATALLGGKIVRVEDCRHMVFDATGAEIPDGQLPSRRALRGEHVDWAEFSLRPPNGTEIPVLIGAAPIRDAKGVIGGAVVVFQDMTAAKELERLRAEWASVVAHDLRQPLNTIVLYAQLLLNRERDADARRSIDRINAAGQRLSRMIDDLMDLSRLDARRLELVRQSLDIVALVRESAARLTLEAPTRAVEVRIIGDVRHANADADRVAQIVDNLLSNAVKYGVAGTPIEIELQQRQDEIAVAVTNEGPGIPPEEVPSLFRRFQRTSDAKVAGIKGTGLGLYITRELVEAHGGRLTVESAPNAKTTFRFTLPAVDRA